MSRKISLVVLLASTAMLAGCGGGGLSSMNPFAEKDVKLQGDRRPVFQQGSGFEGPRKLPPPNSDYVGATMQAGQQVPPAQTQNAQQPAQDAPPPAPR